MKKKVVVFTGAGISAESGVPTFRSGENATWDNVRVEDVATVEAFVRDKQKVLDFYNGRRDELDTVEPNSAHTRLAELEEQFDVTIVTQNIDDLHERGGSTNILHLHGQLRQKYEVADPTTFFPYDGPIMEGDLGPNGSQMRPDVVWFGEMPNNMDESWAAVMEADYLVVVGTMLNVAPASYIPDIVKEGCVIYQVNPNIVPINSPNEVLNVAKVATEGVAEVAELLLEEIAE